jgi:hypothetical protein
MLNAATQRFFREYSGIVAVGVQYLLLYRTAEILKCYVNAGVMERRCNKLGLGQNNRQIHATYEYVGFEVMTSRASGI